MAVLRLHAESRKHAAQVSQPDLRVTPASQLSLRGELTDNSVLFVGRTGAGKSSLINLLHGAPAVSVAEIASATRALEAISCQLGARAVTLVDSPGVGEVGTHADYEAALCRWYEGNAERISAVVLVIQADAKAHADDKRLLEALLGRCERPLLIVVRKDGQEVTREQLLDFMRDKIAKWWLPDDVVFVDSLPHTATGKLLKTRLREEFGSHKLPS